MQLTLTTAFAISAFLPAISAHLIMSNPKQWTVPTVLGPTIDLDDGMQNPLKSDGSNYPCHGVPPEGSVATYQPGSTQPLQLIGSAVHGGGSGQMSITYDTNPTKSTRWGVMTSWEGNHPIQAAGNLDPDAAHVLPLLSFKVPADLPAGKAVVAWTWFNRLGNREMYMQCATVTIGGSQTSKAGFNALPDLLRANTNNGCTVPEGVVAIKYKNPGPQVIGTGTTTIACDNTAPGTGTGSSPPVVTTAAPTRSTSFISLTTLGVPRLAAPSAAAGACAEGTIICTSTTAWSICAGGNAVPMGNVAAGTKCVAGQITKRDNRLTHERRRHHA
ncbi:hypothetical protein Q9L58_000943 [Maublancomyces gigas]|uniref:Lytic polysaccharide monooxygenase n=1 Tax=Discina gigas TaxID=1032678 RepID=A0ABR3GVZ2_9PEZI